MMSGFSGNKTNTKYWPHSAHVRNIGNDVVTSVILENKSDGSFKGITLNKHQKKVSILLQLYQIYIVMIF